MIANCLQSISRNNEGDRSGYRNAPEKSGAQGRLLLLRLQELSREKPAFIRPRRWSLLYHDPILRPVGLRGKASRAWAVFAVRPLYEIGAETCDYPDHAPLQE